MKPLLRGAVALLACAVTAQAAQTFQPGDRVHIGLNGKEGTVLEVGQPLMNGGTMIKVHVDGAGYPPNVGVVYDSATSQVTVTGHGTTAPAIAVAAPAAAPGASASTLPPGKVPPSAASCQQAIRANYPTTGDDQTRMFNFQTFQVTGNGAYESVYKGDSMLGARGHVMQALSITAKYQVITRYRDPNADDRIQSVEAHFKCYNSATSGDLVVEKLDQVSGDISYARKH